jgi:hypothetical protein
MGYTGRDYDIIELQQQLWKETNPARRRDLQHTIQIIRNETGLIRSMRESLLKAHRNGDVKEIKDIHDYIQGKERYGQ